MAYAEKRVSTAKGKKGKVSWRARYKKPDGAWGSETGFPTKGTALAWGEEQEAAIRTGRWIDPDLARTPFGAWARTWMDAQAPRGRTTMNRWNRLERHILPKWEHTPLNAITWFDVEQWSRTMTCAESTVRSCIGLMSQIMTGAVDAQHLLVNPLYGRRRTGTSVRAVITQPKKQADEQWAPPEVVIRLARRLGPAYGLHVLTTAFTGVRFEELAGLHRRNAMLVRRQHHNGDVFTCPTIRIDPDEGALAEYYVKDDEGKNRLFRGLEPPKNKSSARSIDLPPFLAELLEKHLAEWPHEFVFCTLTGKWWWRNAWWEQMRPAADGRPERPKGRGRPASPEWEPIMPGLTMRALRHTHDTWQAQLNVNPVLAHEQAGHRYPGIKGVYQHPTPEMRQYRLDGLQGMYERALRNEGLESLWES